MEISHLVAVAGVITGSAGLAISLLAYGRDRAKLWVDFQPDQRVHNSLIYDGEKIYCIATVTNVGRRPVFIGTVAVLFPDGRNAVLHDHLLDPVGFKEGDAPKHYMIEQALLEKFDEQWSAIFVLVRTSSGYQYRSRFLSKKPKGGKEVGIFGRVWLRLKMRWNIRWAFRSKVLH
jgi:hypothetical protein